jgi:hypothetical protein
MLSFCSVRLDAKVQKKVAKLPEGAERDVI